jgi:hypothetical protein
MNYPELINLSQVWSCIHRDRSWCIATSRVSIAKGENPRGYLTPGTYNGGFLKVTECTDRVPDNAIENAIRSYHNRWPNENFSMLSPSEFRALYIIHRHYETTMD